MRKTLITAAALAALAIGAADAQAADHTITIDATALTVPQINVGGTWYSTSSSFSVTLSEGATYVQTFARVGFTVNSDGTVSYASGYEGFLSGDGTSTLTIDGFDVEIDVSALTYSSVKYGSSTTLSQNSVNTVTLLPNLNPAAWASEYVEGGPVRIQFWVDGDGDVGYASGHEDALSGSGTGRLTVDGCDITIDARGADASSFTLSGHSGSFSTSTTHVVTLLPNLSLNGSQLWARPYVTLSGETTRHYFDVDTDCTLDYASSEDDFLAGRGGSTLFVGISFETTVLQPVNADGSSVFRAGRTIPVKVEVRDHENALVSDEALQLRIYQTSNTISGTVEEVDPVASGSANSGDLFRYDTDGGYYVFNLSTKGFSAGTYRLEFVIDGVVWGDVQLSLRN